MEALGAWGTRWIGEIGDEDLDPKLLLWDMHRNVRPRRGAAGADRGALPVPRRRGAQRGWWLVIRPDDVDVCDDDPGHEVDLTVTTSLRSLTEVWRGDLSWSSALRSGALAVEGTERMRRALPSWFALSWFAGVPAPV